MSFKTIESTRNLILLLLKDMGEATTAELISEAEILGMVECRDRMPGAIADLNSDGLLKKRISKEKKAIVWSLSELVNIDELA